MHSKRGEPSLHGWPGKQISGNVSATLQYFYFDQQSEKFIQAFQKLQLLIFFVDWNITDPYFLKPLLNWEMMIDDTVKLVCVYMLLLREIFRKSIWSKSAKSVMVWTGDKS